MVVLQVNTGLAAVLSTAFAENLPWSSVLRRMFDLHHGAEVHVPEALLDACSHARRLYAG